MTFGEVLDQVRELLQQRGRVTYRSLKLRYQLDEELLAGVTNELIKAERVAADEDGDVLVWIGVSPVSGSTFQVPRSQPLTPSTQPPDARPKTLDASPSDGERRQLTVMFIDLSDSDSVRPELVEGCIALPDDLIAAVIARTDGVPLFVEELTKTVLESVESIESVRSGRRLGQSSLLSGIPATLQDALMARLDRLGPVKEVAQLGATLGREFSYELMQAVCPLDEVTLQHGLKQLVEAELMYQRGLLPRV